jgi:glycine/D-amino acid oxidase-like deaminating enzyme
MLISRLKHHAASQIAVRADEIAEYLRKGYLLRMRGEVSGQVNLFSPAARAGLVDGGRIMKRVAIYLRVKEMYDQHNEAMRRDARELSPKVGDVGNREGGISWGCLTPPLLHRRSDMPCPRITSSS